MSLFWGVGDTERLERASSGAHFPTTSHSNHKMSRAPRARPSHPGDDTLYGSIGEDQSYGEGGHGILRGRSLLD
jgi:hypothetical protein